MNIQNMLNREDFENSSKLMMFSNVDFVNAFWIVNKKLKSCINDYFKI